jgi:DNA-binding PadR family transcriptional regulator
VARQHPGTAAGPAGTLTETSYAILGHLSLRRWTAYELSRSVNRSLRWFWSRAESRIYAELTRLAAQGLVTAHRTAVGARPRTTYAITAKGRRALVAWLSAPSSGTAGFVLHFESLLRVHLARAGTREDLLRAIADARALAAEIHGNGREVAVEYVEGRHPLQDEAHVRAIVFDFLWSLANGIDDWARRTHDEVRQWDSLDPTGKTERGITLMRTALEQPTAPGSTGVEDQGAVRAALDALTHRFFAAVSFEPGRRPGYHAIRDLFIEDGRLVRNSGARPEIATVDQFIEPRQRSVDSGELSAFNETETAEITEIFGNVAHRFSTYTKSGVLGGVPFTGRGMISTQFVRTPDGWRISTMAWDDERPGLTIPERYRRPRPVE